MMVMSIIDGQRRRFGDGGRGSVDRLAEARRIGSMKNVKTLGCRSRPGRRFLATLAPQENDSDDAGDAEEDHSRAEDAQGRRQDGTVGSRFCPNKKKLKNILSIRLETEGLIALAKFFYCLRFNDQGKKSCSTLNEQLSTTTTAVKQENYAKISSLFFKMIAANKIRLKQDWQYRVGNVWAIRPTTTRKETESPWGGGRRPRRVRNSGNDSQFPSLISRGRKEREKEKREKTCPANLVLPTCLVSPPTASRVP